MLTPIRLLLSLLLICLVANIGYCQDLEYLAPILSKNPIKDTASLILTTGNDAWAEGIPQKKIYTNSVQIIDADEPWPPRWYSATPVYTAEMFHRDTLAGVSRFDWMIDAEVVSGYFSYYKLLSHPLMKDGPLQNVELAAYLLLNEKMQCIDTVKTEKGVENMFYRSLSINSKGERLVGLKKDTYLDLRMYSHNQADSSVHCEIDILEVFDPKGNLLFSWNPMDHLDPKLFRFKELLTGRAYGYGKTDIIQWTRLTNAQWDVDGNIIYSMLLYGVGKISRSDGHIIWQINSNQMPMLTGKDTLQWYRQHDFKFLYETDSSTVYSLFSNGLKGSWGQDSISACGVIFEQNKKTLAIRLLKYQYPKIKFVTGGQGGYDYDIKNGNYFFSYGNLKSPISSEVEFTENFEYGNNDRVFGIFLMPQHIHCFKAHRLENFSRPPRPSIIKNGNELEALGDLDGFTWYKMSGPNNTTVEKIGNGRKLKFESGCTYCVVGKYGVGYCVSHPFSVEKSISVSIAIICLAGLIALILIGFSHTVRLWHSGFINSADKDYHMTSSQTKFKRAVFAALPIILLVAYCTTIYIMMVPGHSIAPKIITCLQILATIILLASIISIGSAYYVVVAPSSLSELMKNITLSATLIAIMILCAECFFLHYARSEGVGIQWSYKLWDKKFLNHRTYFHYINTKGQNESASFREPISGVQKKKKPIWFIGDSFTFGFGIEQTEETFPAQVERLLGGRYLCLNLGDGGADTYKEKENLFAFQRNEKQVPAVIVWQYFGNDIDANDEGPDLYEKELSKNAWIRFGQIFFCHKSFLLDFIYWHYFVDRKGNWVNTYSDFLERMYHNDSMTVDGVVLKDSVGYVSPYHWHLIPLKEAAAYYKSRRVNFLVIIFPFLWQGGPERSEQLYSHRLESELKSDGTDVINLTPLVKDIPVENRVINPHDPHPSILIDRITADTIAKYLVSEYGM